MIRTVIGLCLGLSIVLMASLATAQAPPGIFPNQMCWKKKVVRILFNPALDISLESPNSKIILGNAADRWATMEEVIDRWNAALKDKAVNAGITLKLVRTKNFASQQGQKACVDATNGADVFQTDYTKTHPDTLSVGSTAENNRQVNLGAGWIVGDTIETAVIDQRLAETALDPKPNNMAAKEITEADVLFFTHVTIGGNKCPQIEWSYLPPTVAVVPPRGRYDFYSVMLHEVGHAIGLDHQFCPLLLGPTKTIPNVMAMRINPGVRADINACEMAALRQLYGPAGNCAPGNIVKN